MREARFHLRLLECVIFNKSHDQDVNTSRYGYSEFRSKEADLFKSKLFSSSRATLPSFQAKKRNDGVNSFKGGQSPMFFS